MTSKAYAYIFSSLYAVVIVALLLWVRISVRPQESQEVSIIYIEMVQPEEKPIEKPKSQPRDVVKPKVSNEAPRHEKPAPKNNSQEAAGKAEEVRTVNQKALFQMPKDGVDKPEDVGNKEAKQSTENTAKGEAQGLKPAGNQFVDEGLRGRGLNGSLPRPIYPPGNVEGKVVVKVDVNMAGVVTSATFTQAGSTTQDPALIAAAIAAAKKARFKEASAPTIGGRITYIFRVK